MYAVVRPANASIFPKIFCRVFMQIMHHTHLKPFSQQLNDVFMKVKNDESLSGTTLDFPCDTNEFQAHWNFALRSMKISRSVGAENWVYGTGADDQDLDEKDSL